MYSLADPTFFETPTRLADRATRFEWDQKKPPLGWFMARQGLWTVLSPAGMQLAEQGWKIHVSTTPTHASITLQDTAQVCLKYRVPFKFIRSEQAVLLMSDKYMSRSSSGKFITIYPPDETTFLKMVADLSSVLHGRPGPYILSDLRIGEGPVYVRYGAFVQMRCRDEGGNPVLALRHPDGRLVPDERGVIFRLPSWVTVPEELKPHLTARAAARDDDFPYAVDRALQFSNAGGIYLARHLGTGERVVLREARPHCGLDTTGDDAVTRLYREHEALTRLAGLACVPRTSGVLVVWEHHFLIQEHIEGHTLFDEILTRYALVRDDRGLTEYRAWVDKVIGQLATALDHIHARGLRFGDLHPSNIMLRSDGSLVLIDFEYATDLDSSRPFAGAFGMRAPVGTRGADVDAFALWSIWLHMLIPVTEMIEHDQRKALLLERWARGRYGLQSNAGPPRPAILTQLGRGSEAGDVECAPDPVLKLVEDRNSDWAGLRAGLLAGLRATATPERDDRLFPGAPDGFANGGLCAAYGAAGVLHALRMIGEPVPEQWLDWMVDSALRRDPTQTGGLFDGLPGVAVVLSGFNRIDVAAELLDRALASPLPDGIDLFTGQAGVALAALRFAMNQPKPDSSLIESTLLTARKLARVVREETSEFSMPSTAGLLRGLSGAALLLLELHALTEEAWLLDAARDMLHWEARHCVSMPGGSVQAKDGHRHLLYLDQGSGGFALVAAAYLKRHGDPMLEQLLPRVREGCVAEVVREPGLFTGRAGLAAIAHALDGGGDQVNEDVLASVRNLAWHLVARGEQILVPGGGLQRFSADLATGAAGVLLMLRSLSSTSCTPETLLDMVTLK